ncbi:MAG: hypothetical protein HY591_03915 [Candidatus Omnitrophica bacterium]|nr:hypothetical protein [Candidatus Omnitrophota bacterium]
MFALLLVLSFIAFAPSFFTDFGMHNDYSMFDNTGNPWLRSIESYAMVEKGRFLGGILFSVVCASLTTIHDFAKVRVLSYLFAILAAAGIIYLLRRRYRLEANWSILIAFGILFLPTSQVNILWVCEFMQGSFSVFLTVLCCALREASRGKSKTGTAAAFVLLIAIIFIYPSTALFITALFLARLLFLEGPWPAIRRQAWFDAAFVGLAMAGYRLVDQYIVMNIAAHYGISSHTGDEGDTGITGNFLAKLPLLRQVLLVSLSGAWHPLLQEWGAAIPVAIMGACAACAWHCQKRIAWFSSTALQKTLFFLVLLALSIAPCLLAKEYFNLSGYRILLPPAALIVVMLFYALIQTDSLARRRYHSGIVLALAIAMTLAAFAVCFWNVGNVVNNHDRELKFARARINACDTANVNRYLVFRIPVGNAYIKQKMFYEFNFVIKMAGETQSIVTQLLKEKGTYNPDYRTFFLSEPFIIKLYAPTPQDCVINLNEAVDK